MGAQISKTAGKEDDAAATATTTARCCCCRKARRRSSRRGQAKRTGEWPRQDQWGHLPGHRGG
ncbi:hypothetical protein CRUP_014994 [Coryphaenoides rupestris]|nr:hypothetical protein CRUP_014994 [Coryphaenoides rupestris]